MRISIKNNNTGNSHKIELIKMPFGKRYFVRFDGVNSKKVDDISISELSVKLRELIGKMA